MQDLKIYSYLFILSTVSLVALLLFPAHAQAIELQIIGLILMATIGIIHGANDLFIYRQTAHRKVSTIVFVISYLLFAVIIGIVIYLQPLVGINLFVLISAFHFGEEHFSWWYDRKTPAFLIWCFIYGLSIFSLLFLTHLETLESFLVDNNYKVSVLSWSYFLLVPILVIQSMLGLGHLFLGRVSLFKFCFLQLTLILLFFVFKNLDLLTAFAFYFVFWHSIPSVFSQVDALGLSHKQGLWLYIKKALPFYTVSLAGIIILYLWLGQDLLSLTTIVLIGAMTTIPHIVVFLYLRVLK